MSIRGMSDEQFYHLMKDLIGSEGGFHAADNNSRRESESAPRDDDAGSVVALQG
ncbi:hypothetical protein [Enterobacter cloacae complex sp. 372C4]|uniref:hypothetical protein n=1 Tax=unclassified Enterobacter cloacae complex TaxID=2757714 RepID=UPI003CFAA5FC